MQRTWQQAFRYLIDMHAEQREMVTPPPRDPRADGRCAAQRTSQLRDPRIRSVLAKEAERHTALLIAGTARRVPMQCVRVSVYEIRRRAPRSGALMKKQRRDSCHSRFISVDRDLSRLTVCAPFLSTLSLRGRAS